ncbi:YLR345W [Zygosaccharomyces parabailii]|nr:YLR345W [Zygosaccharomyces parabailii]CDH12757.1 related to Putative 6-phosphofructo-2-kinase/fructose-2,6-bisphosphatase YLR345W [Zygosaccharomyces bailii ISA1307]
MVVLISDEESIVEEPSMPISNHMGRRGKRWSGSGQVRPIKKIEQDGVHEPVEAEDYISPGQLYSTESGRLFHAGRILIVLVGLPATSKTLLSVAITRYTRWLGVRTKSFHVSEYRRQQEGVVPDDYFSAVPQTKEGIEYRQKVLKAVHDDMVNFFMETKGQLAVYDALNIRRSERNDIAEKFSKMKIKVLFIESVMTDTDLVDHTIKMAAQSSDYHGLPKVEARAEFMKRVRINKPLYEAMQPEEGLSYVEYINFGERLRVYNNFYGYLTNKIVFFLMNLRGKKGCVYFARCGTSDKDNYLNDEELNEEGRRYSKALTDLVLRRVNERRRKRHGALTPAPGTPSTTDTPYLLPTQASLDREAYRGDHRVRQMASWDGADEDSFVVWTAPRKRTYDTAKYFEEKGITVRQRSQLQQLHPGVVADMSEEEIKKKYPREYAESLKDPYHYRFPRAESYHDLAVRMEPILLEMERMCGDLLIIGHESTLKVLYGYLMACTCTELPNLKFPRDKLIEISFSPFQNHAKIIPIV